MTARQPVEYALVEYRKNPARPEQGRLLLGIVFAISDDRMSVLGLRSRVGIPDIELEGLDSLTRDVVKHRRTALKSEVEAAMQSANAPEEVLAVLSSKNPWAFHVGKPTTASVDRFDAAKMSLEDWVDSWTSGIFQDEASASAQDPVRRPTGRVRKRSAEIARAEPATAWLEAPRLIRKVAYEPLPA